MACILRKEQVAVLALLLTIARTCPLNDHCSLDNVPPLEPSFFLGRWYLYQFSCAFPGYETLVGKMVDVTSTEHSGVITRHMTVDMKLNNGAVVCGIPTSCTLRGATCTSTSSASRYNSTIFSKNHESYVVIWTEATKVNTLDVYVRDLATASETMTANNVTATLVQACGSKVRDFGFFTTLTPKNTPNCA